MQAMKAMIERDGAASLNLDNEGVRQLVKEDEFMQQVKDEIEAQAASIPKDEATEAYKDEDAKQLIRTAYDVFQKKAQRCFMEDTLTPEQIRWLDGLTQFSPEQKQGMIERVNGMDEETPGFTFEEWITAQERELAAQGLNDAAFMQELRDTLLPIYNSFERNEAGNIVSDQEAQGFFDKAQAALQ